MADTMLENFLLVLVIPESQGEGCGENSRGRSGWVNDNQI
jgi:hypothetical protein